MNDNTADGIQYKINDRRKIHDCHLQLNMEETIARGGEERRTAIMLPSALVLEAITLGRYALWSFLEYETPPWPGGEGGRGSKGRRETKKGRRGRGAWEDEKEIKKRGKKRTIDQWNNWSMNGE